VYEKKLRRSDGGLIPAGSLEAKEVMGWEGNAWYEALERA